MPVLADAVYKPHKVGAGCSTGLGALTFYGATEGRGGGAWHERDDTDGVPAPPCMVQLRRGILRPPVVTPWPVDPGTRTLRIWCKHSGHTPLPRVVVRPNPTIGVNAQAEAVATASTGWQELVVVVNPTVKGALEIWLEVRAAEMGAWAKWDEISAG